MISCLHSFPEMVKTTQGRWRTKFSPQSISGLIAVISKWKKILMAKTSQSEDWYNDVVNLVPPEFQTMLTGVPKSYIFESMQASIPQALLKYGEFVSDSVTIAKFINLFHPKYLKYSSDTITDLINEKRFHPLLNGISKFYIETEFEAYISKVFNCQLDSFGAYFWGLPGTHTELPNLSSLAQRALALRLSQAPVESTFSHLNICDGPRRLDNEDLLSELF